MSENPLQKLDSAIEEFLQETDGLSGGRFISGWMLGVSLSRIQSEDEIALPLVSGMTYTFGPQTHIAQAAGIAKYLEVVAEIAFRRTFDEDGADT